MKNIKKHFLFLIFLVLLIFLIFSTYKDYGITWDEKVYLQVGRHFAINILNAFNIPHNLREEPFLHGEVHLQSHGVFFDVLIVLTTPFFNKFNFDTYHLIKALFTIPAFIFLYLIILKLLNKKWALFSVILLLLFPRFYGDIYTNSIDIPTLTVFSSTIACFLYLLNTKKIWLSLVLFSFSLALLINQRVVFWYVFLVSGIFFIKKPKLLFSLGFLTLIFMHLTHPYLWEHPVTGILSMLNSSKSFPFMAANLFEGNFILGPDLPWYYLLKLMLITAPLSIVFLFIIGNFHLAGLIFSKKVVQNKKYFYIYLLLVFYIPIFLTILLKPVIYDSIRHYLFLIFPFMIIAVFGASTIWKLKNNLLKTLLVLLIVINLGQTAFKMISLHPYQYIYYNELIGGLKGAYRTYETDYWGAGFKEAVDWFNKNVNDPDEIYLIYSEGDRLSTETYFKNNMVFTYDLKKVDYIFTFTRWNVDQRYPGKIIYTIEREGIPLIFIKENIK